MKLSQAIARFQKVIDEKGDCDLMMEDEDGSVISVDDMSVMTAAKDEFPPDWNMPEGYTFVLLEAFR